MQMLDAILAAMSATTLAEWVRSDAWAYPLIEIVHISGFGVMVGTVVTVEMRVFGFHKVVSALELGRLGVHIATVAFAVAVGSGLMLFISDASGFIANRAFLAKLALIALAALNMVVFHARGSLVKLDRVARAQAALSLTLWLLVISAGRLIAYI